MQYASAAPVLLDQLRIAELALAESQALLAKILPNFVIERLKKLPQEPIADSFSNASVLFADIEGFVAIARTLGGRKTVNLLDRLMREFDALAARHGVEKIKTIGDAYMAVAGIPQSQDDHCERLAELALDMLAAAGRVGSDTGVEIKLRIGIAAGPVMAGVIGVSKFAYDVWGNTVNLAARLERLATSGQILLCRRAKRQLGSRFRLSSRGEVTVRGLGTGEIWALEAASPASPTNQHLIN